MTRASMLTMLLLTVGLPAQAGVELAASYGREGRNAFSKGHQLGAAAALPVSARWAIRGELQYTPDLGKADLKGLTGALLRLASNGPGGTTFQQPLSKTVAAGSVAARFAVPGRFSVLGGKDIRTEWTGSLGVGALRNQHYIATYNPELTTFPDYVDLTRGDISVHATAVIGAGARLVVSPAMRVGVRTHASFYMAPPPQYDPSIPPQGTQIWSRDSILLELTAILGSQADAEPSE